jgi:(p)ppGpp synthase/HD superfamily hydrolase
MMDHPTGAGRSATTLDAVLAAFLATWPGSDVRMIEDAFAMAAHWHDGQWRRSGDPYITHPVAVAAIVAGLGVRREMVCAALLHDLPEDTGCSLDLLRERFGAEVADLVAGILELDRDPTLREAISRDPAGALSQIRVNPDVIVLKLADRLHNMRTIRYVEPAKQRRRSQETLDILVPLAAQLGLDAVRHELADLASWVLRPDRYDESRTEVRWTLRIAAILLPNVARARWLEEWTGELAVLPTRRSRATFVVRIICGMPRLALTLRFPASNRVRQ